MNQTIRRKTSDEFYDACFALIPVGFLPLDLPHNGKYLGFLAWSLIGFVFAAYNVQHRLRRRSPRDASTSEAHTNAKTSGPMLIAVWALVVSSSVAAVWFKGPEITAILSSPLAPVWHRACVVLVANYYGWSAFWVWRALYDLTAELLRTPKPATIAAPVALSVTPQAALGVLTVVAPPAAAPLSLGQGKSTP